MKFYNEDIKNEFLGQYSNEDSAKIMGYLFKNTYLTEKSLNKDLLNFNLKEIEEVIVSMNPKSFTVAANHVSMISVYLTWAIKNNHRTDNINPISGMGNEWIKTLVNENVKQFITKDELDEMVSHLVNYQDKIIPVLIFHGVYGNQSSELRNLKMSDINQETGETRLYDVKKGERTIFLPLEVVEMTKKAHYEMEYQSKNGLSQSSRSGVTELTDSDYVLKSAKRGAKLTDNMVSQLTVIKRVKFALELMGYHDMTLKTISRSGMIYMAYELMKESDKDEIDLEIINKIGEHFNWTKVKHEDGEYYNSTYVKNFINKDNIDDLYGILV